MLYNMEKQETVDDNDKYELILNAILPPKSDSYSLTELEQILRVKTDSIEAKQRNVNNFYNQVLDDTALHKLEFLRNNLHTFQLDFMKLQCDVAFTKEQLDTIRTTFNHPAIKERQVLIAKEKQLKKSIRQVRFEPCTEFFSRLIKCLESSIDSCKRICRQQVVNDFLMFDWSLFQQTMLLLKSCGKALLDLAKFELLYQSPLEITAINFKQHLNQIDFKQLMESYDTYSLETLIELIDDKNRRIELNEVISTSGLANDYSLFKDRHSSLQSLCVSCCKILLDLNMNYIDHLLTHGINIDKLNGNDSTNSLTQHDIQPMPLYAFSPQEYITQIGQHLLTLRKQTQQFDNTDIKSLKCGLEHLEQAQDIPMDVKTYTTVTEIIMRCVARHCIRSLLARTNKSILNKLTINGKRQLSTDALYLDNVLEDLNLLDSNEPNAEKFKGLLVQ